MQKILIPQSVQSNTTKQQGKPIDLKYRRTETDSTEINYKMETNYRRTATDGKLSLKKTISLLMENQVMRHLVIPTLSTGRARDVGHRAARIHNQGKLLWWCPDPKSRRIVPTLRNQSQSESQSQKNNRREITIRYRRMNDQCSGKAHYPFRSRSSWRYVRALGLLDPSRCRRRESGEAREEL